MNKKGLFSSAMLASVTLRTKLLIQYMVIVLVSMLVIPTGISELLNMQFRHFATERLAENEQAIINFYTKCYESDKGWITGNKDTDELLRWPIVRAELSDMSGKEVSSIAVRQNKHRPRRNIELIEQTRDIVIGGKCVGHIRFSYLPFNESPEGKFLKHFNHILYYCLALMLAAAAGIAVFMSYRISRPVLEASKRAEEISNGNYTAEQHISSDISELQCLMESVYKLGEKLDEQERLRNRLMSDIAHELRNPVTVIKAHLEAIEDGVWEATPERIRLTVSEVDRLSSLINEVSSLTTIENAACRFEKTDISALLEKAVRVFEPMYGNRGISFTYDIEPDVEAEVDSAKFRTCAGNLMSNALRYTESRVHVSLAAKDGMARLSVADNGIGIAEKDLPYIFERFYRTDKSRARASGGIGIGLSIVKAIADAHNGSVNVESIQGKGSTFTVSFPLTQKQEV